MPQKYGYMANGVANHKTCLVCDDPAPIYSWTDYHGEGYCTRCGTSYQLTGGELAEGETYPRCNVLDKWIPILREYWNETHKLNGCGNYFMWADYPEQMDGRDSFNEWLERRHPELIESEKTA